MVKLLVTGDRNWRNARVIYEAITDWEAAELDWGESYTLINGEAMGADIISDVVVQLLDHTDDFSRARIILRFPADWNQYGRRAGPVRNQQMLDEGPDYVLGFHNDIENSRGTKDMLRRCAAAGIPGRLYTEEGMVEDWQSIVLS